MIETARMRPAMRSGFFVLLLACGLLVSPVHGQTLAGKWVAPWRVLDNGENDPMYLDLNQTGTQVTGTVTTIGHVRQVEGTIKGNHFELYSGSTRNDKPLAARGASADL
jgi:hypothetical protein